jgi:hypothetical protein
MKWKATAKTGQNLGKPFAKNKQKISLYNRD